MENYPRVLSIQSHVVSGYVGNKCATFPLQLLGFEVDAINSVQFSNHTGYPIIKGQLLKEQDLVDLMDGLRANKLDSYTHLLTGYIGSPSFLNQIISVTRQLRSINPNLVYVCDPVMGDNGSLYVPKEIVPLYKQSLVSLADIITPNQFELEILTDVRIKTMEDAWRAMNEIQMAGCKTVVLTTTELGDENNLVTLASTINSDGRKTAISINSPKLKGEFTGAGDLFSALFLAWMYKSTNDIKSSLEKTVASMQAVINATAKYNEGKPNEPQFNELRLIQNKKYIENPDVKISANVIF